MTKLRVLTWLLLLALAGGRVDAALSGAEKKAFDAAADEFRMHLWDRAEAGFAQFIESYPKSERLHEAILLQAQSQFQQSKFLAAVALLTAREAEAGSFLDQYLYWAAEAQFRNHNYPAAAGIYGRLVKEFPTSARRLEAAVGEAAARVKQSEWTQVTNLLGRAEGAFRQSALGLTNNATVAQGFLLLAEAYLALTNDSHAEAVLNKIAPTFGGELEWRRRHLLCRALVGSGRPEEALRESAGLITAAEEARRRDLLSESVAMRASLCVQLGQRDEAITLLTRNLATNAPVAWQEDALAKITALALEQGQFEVAIERLLTFVNQLPSSPATPVALLTLGEIYLKQQASLSATNQNGAANGAVTNRLVLAMNSFDQVLRVHTNSPLAGRAQLGRGWSFWLEKKFPESAAAFGAAAGVLPVSPDLAVARFKLADAQYAQSNYVAALDNYRSVLRLITNWPAVNDALRTPATYQALRSSLALAGDPAGTNLTAADAAMRELLATATESAAAPGSLLLVAQGYVDARQPAEAQRLFAEFITRFPDSELRPQVELLLARVLEDQSAWTNAIAAYDGWLTRFSSNALAPQVEFQRALAVARSGDETNALNLFTNFIAHFRTNDLAPRAQWWVADHFFNRGEFTEAEIKFKELFQNWNASELAYEARLMAGRAAVQWSGYPNAIEYFTGLTSDTNCPPDLWASAMLAYGGVRIRAETNRLAGYTAALQIFGQIHRSFTNHEYAALAWGEMGNCYLQLATVDPRNYEAASNAYQTVITMPAAGVAARSQAQCGLAAVLEKLAEAGTEAERKTLLLRARDCYLDVALEKNLRAGEAPDDYWVKEAGFRALRLLELMQGWPTQDTETIISFCRRLQKLLPVYQARLESIIQRAQNPSSLEKSPRDI